MTTLPDRLRADLTAALRAREKTTVAVLRTVLAAIANAEAVPAGAAAEVVPPEDGPVAGAAKGVGATEAARRELTERDLRTIVAAERDDLLATSEQLADKAPDRAAELRASAEVLDRYL